MAEIVSEAMHVEVFHENTLRSRNESDGVSVVSSCRDVNKVLDLNIQILQTQNNSISESPVLCSELSNGTVLHTDAVSELEEESSYTNNMQLNNIENVHKRTNLSCNLIKDVNVDKTDDNHVSDGIDTQIVHVNLVNGIASSVPVCNVKDCKTKKKGVSFPKDTSISRCFDHPDPWKNALLWTSDDLVSAYKKSCELYGTKPIMKLVQQLQTMHSSTKREEMLSLKGEKLDQKQCECLEEILKRSQFKLLDLEASHLDDECSVAVFDMIEYYESACQLNIAFNKNIQARGWQACSRLVRRTPSLTCLDMRGCDLNESTIPIFGRSLKLGCHLTILHMENMNLSGRPLLILVAALKMNETLQELFLGDNKIIPTDAVQLGHLLRSNHKLSLLDLRNNHLQDYGAIQICEGLLEQTKGCGLRTLVLWNNFINHQAMAALGRALVASQHLETLNIGHNTITNEGVHLLKDGLLRVNSLLRLGLQGTKISDEGAVAMAEYIAESTILLRIDLRDNDIKTGGLMALSHAMRVNTSVTKIDVDKDPKREPGMKDYIEQQSRLLRDILTFQQRNVEIKLQREEQNRAQLKEKAEAEIAAAKKEADTEQPTGTLPANSSTESFTLIEHILESNVEQSLSNKDAADANIKIVDDKHLDQVSSENSCSVEKLDTLPQKDDGKHQKRPDTLFPDHGISPQPSLGSSTASIDVYQFAADSDELFESVSQPDTHCPIGVPAQTLGSATSAEMILSPQYFPKQVARKIFSVVRVKEQPSTSQLSPSPTSPHSTSYDPLSVSPVPLVSLSSSPLSTTPDQHCSENISQHPTSVLLQTACPNTLLSKDLIEESMKNMVSPDVSSTNKSEPCSSNTILDDIKEIDHKDFSSENGSSILNYNMDIAVSDVSENVSESDRTLPVSHIHDGVCGNLNCLVDETVGSEVSTSNASLDAEDSVKENAVVSDHSVTDKEGVLIPEEDREVLMPEDIDLQQPKLLLLESTPEEEKHHSTKVSFDSEEFILRPSATNCNQDIKNVDDFVAETKHGTDVGKTTTESDIIINAAGTVYDKQFQDISCDNDNTVSTIIDSSKNDANSSDSENYMAAFLPVGDKDIADSSVHLKGIGAEDEVCPQSYLTANGIGENLQSVYRSNEKHLLSIVAEVYKPEEVVSSCLNNFNSPSLLVSEELPSATFQDKSVISQFASCDSGEHSFSSIVDLLRLDIHDMSDRRDMQFDALMPSLKTTDESTDNLDIENVEFSLDEEPWLTVGVEIDVDNAETSMAPLKQPDFFTTLSMNGLTQELASALTSLDGSTSPFEAEDYDLDS